MMRRACCPLSRADPNAPLMHHKNKTGKQKIYFPAFVYVLDFFY
jgi:hypothetical protein